MHRLIPMYRMTSTTAIHTCRVSLLSLEGTTQRSMGFIMQLRQGYCLHKIDFLRIELSWNIMALYVWVFVVTELTGAIYDFHRRDIINLLQNSIIFNHPTLENTNVMKDKNIIIILSNHNFYIAQFFNWIQICWGIPVWKKSWLKFEHRLPKKVTKKLLQKS